MSYQCPRCGDRVTRIFPRRVPGFGLLGPMVYFLFVSCECARCGLIPRREFAPEDRRKMALTTLAMMTLAAAGVSLAVFLIAYLTRLR